VTEPQDHAVSYPATGVPSPRGGVAPRPFVAEVGARRMLLPEKGRKLPARSQAGG